MTWSLSVVTTEQPGATLLIPKSTAPVDLSSHLRVPVLFKSLLHHGLGVLNSCGHAGIKLPSPPQLYIIHTYVHNHDMSVAKCICSDTGSGC